MAETELLQLNACIKQIKSETYAVVNAYKKLQYTVKNDPKIVSKVCKISKGQVAPNGEIFITMDMLEAFTKEISNKCEEYGTYWSGFMKAADVFIQNQLDFISVQDALTRPHSEQLEKLYNIWCGDEYPDVKRIEGLCRFIDIIGVHMRQINIKMFNDMTIDYPKSTKNSEEPILLETDELIRST